MPVGINRIDLPLSSGFTCRNDRNTHLPAPREYFDALESAINQNRDDLIHKAQDYLLKVWRKKGRWFKLDDILVFEHEHAIIPMFKGADSPEDYIKKRRGEGKLEVDSPEDKQKSRSSDDRNKAIEWAKIYAKEDKTLNEAAKNIKQQCFSEKKWKLDTIKDWIRDIFPPEAKKRGAPKKINTREL